ncbi:uncharacterized protein LOC130656563 [Hydractinia symbiolongicarpus]|uniref:uncharacterized protein LOC130656563 n=1 Tax=Hydractinia symbiolongicarpus TaxID=13093 RepID=UPI00254E7E2E|nr:uncharacterized protein LOC130656563 [Hydractinia symbiolongicarpus]
MASNMGLLFLTLLICIVYISKGDILRLSECNKFYAVFDVVFNNFLLINTTYSLVRNIELNRCLIICMQYPRCKSFSYMFHHSQCRIHHSTRTDTGSNLQKENGWTHYETNENATNVGPVCEERKPCNFGKCVDTCDDKGYKCEYTCSGEWILLKRNVCFGARANQFGTFKLTHDAVMTGIKLVHVGGPGLTCIEDTPPTKWGCDYGHGFVVENVAAVITDEQNNTLYPSMKYHIRHGFFNVPGYNANSSYLIYNATSYTVHKEQELRIHYGEAWASTGQPANNNGTSCADIYAKLCYK